MLDKYTSRLAKAILKINDEVAPLLKKINLDQLATEFERAAQVSKKLLYADFTLIDTTSNNTEAFRAHFRFEETAALKEFSQVAAAKNMYVEATFVEKPLVAQLLSDKPGNDLGVRVWSKEPSLLNSLFEFRSQSIGHGFAYDGFALHEKLVEDEITPPAPR